MWFAAARWLISRRSFGPGQLVISWEEVTSRMRLTSAALTGALVPSLLASSTTSPLM
ncbi:Uncharacterised protein [Mycobacteroides abscessus subsp. abscessus]|nr:Uncharacterised protein [Mycobacteroides abscessus subsp. abscessus]